MIVGHFCGLLGFRMTCLPGRRVVIIRCPYIALFFFGRMDICKGRARAFCDASVNITEQCTHSLPLRYCLHSLYLESEFSDE